MKIACLSAFASLRGVLLFTALASIAGAQTRTWIRQLGTNQYDGAHAVASDGAGGVYVGGSTGGSLGGPNTGDSDVWLARYDGAGVQLWIRQFGSTGGEGVEAAVCDGAGGVYVGGTTSGNFGGPNAGSSDVWFARYDAAGNQLWIRQFGSSASEGAMAAALDGVGGVYVSGSSEGNVGGPHAGDRDAWVAHYDGAGNQTWIRQFGTPATDTLRRAAPDGMGGVFVTGWSLGSFGGPHTWVWSAWLARYDSAGNQTWIRQFGTNQMDEAHALAPDGVGGLYVGGKTRGNLGGPNAGSSDVWLARYDSAGNQTWIRQFGTSAGEGAEAAAYDGVGGVYLSGWSGGSLGGQLAGSHDPWVAHYDGAGTQLWIQQFGTTEEEFTLTAAPDGSGGVYVGGDTRGSLGGPNTGGGRRSERSGVGCLVRALRRSRRDSLLHTGGLKLDGRSGCVERDR